MFRKQKKNEGDLAKILEDKASGLEKFMKPVEGGFPSTELRDELTKEEVEELNKILTGLSSQAAPLEILLDRGIKDLEGHGMLFNSEKKRMENIFAEHTTDKVVDGVSKTDNSRFSPEENFGGVLKKAFGLVWKKDPDNIQLNGSKTRGISGMSREQACLEMVQQYERDKKGDQTVETGFLSDLIGLRAKHNAILGATCDTLDYLSRVDKNEVDEGSKMAAGNQLSAVIISLREAAVAVRKTNDYSHLMSAKEFQSETSILGFRRPEILKQIDHELRVLQEPPSSLIFWKKQVPLSNDQRSMHLETLKSLVQDAKASPDVNKRRKAGLEKLLPQIDYAIQKTWTVQMQEKQLRQQQKLASLKEPATRR